MTTDESDWVRIPGFSDYMMNRVTSEVRDTTTGETPHITHDGKGQILFWLYDDEGKIDLRTLRGLRESVFLSATSPSGGHLGDI